MDKAVPEKKSKTQWLNWWLLREPINLLTESFIFTVFTVALILLTPYELQENALDIIFESVGIESFFITLVLTILMLPIFLLFLGPYIEPKNQNHYKEWLSELFGWDEKFRAEFLKTNRKMYEKIFIPLYQFNFSFGIGTLGVLIGLLVCQLKYQNIHDTKVLSTSIFIMVVFVLVSKFLGHISTFNHMNELDFKPNKKNIRITYVVCFIVSIFVAVFTLPEIYEKLNKPIISSEAIE